MCACEAPGARDASRCVPRQSVHERVLAEASVQKTLGLGSVGGEPRERGGILGAARRRRELGKSEEDGERGLAYLKRE